VLGVYVLGGSVTSQFNSWGAKPPVAGTAAAIANALDPCAWHHLSAGTGAKGERLFDWAYLELADIEAAEYNQTLSGVWTRGLSIRCNIADDELAFWPANGTAPISPAGASGGRNTRAGVTPNAWSLSTRPRPAPGQALGQDQ
jgi:SRSO17 transposase